MFCDRCGALNESGGLLCLQCGSSLSEPARKPVPPPKEEAPAAPAAEPLAEAPLAPAVPAPPPEHPCPQHADMPVAGTCPRCGKFVCVRCAPGVLDNDLLCSDCLARTKPADGEGIGGWLILPAIGVVLTPIVCLAGLLTALANAPFEAALSGGLGVYGFVCAVSFFQRKRHTPMLMIGLYIANAVVGLAADHAVRGVGLAAIWIAYFLRSERVKRTFVK